MASVIVCVLLAACGVCIKANAYECVTYWLHCNYIIYLRRMMRASWRAPILVNLSMLKINLCGHKPCLTNKGNPKRVKGLLILQTPWMMRFADLIYHWCFKTLNYDQFRPNLGLIIINHFFVFAVITYL